MIKQEYFIKVLSKENGVTVLYLPKSLSVIGYGSSKHVKLVLNEDETITLSKIKGIDNIEL